jgi:DNA-binding MarR family transcriptional regulator
LSRRIGTMEPTTMSAIQAMEQSGFVRRLRNPGDRRKINIYLTEKGRELEALLLPAGIDVVQTATKDFTQRETDMLLSLLSAIQKNLRDDLRGIDDIDEE